MNSDALVRRLYQSFADGDVPSIIAALSPDIRWTQMAGLPHGGVYVGPEAVLNNVFVTLAAEWEDFKVEPAQFITEGEAVVALGHYSGTHKETRKPISRIPFAHVWKVFEDKVVRFDLYTDTKLISAATVLG
jgi:ketosteroid isomerase-like protein